MARTTWSVRNYNAFLREAKRELGIKHRQAQQLYRDLRYDLDRPLYGADVKRELTVPTVEAEAELAEYGVEATFTIREYYEGVELAEGFLMEGTELELSAQTEGGIYLEED